MKDFTKYLYEKQLSKNTIHEITRVVTHFLSWLENENILIQECFYTDVMAYVTYLQNQHVKPSYINSCLSNITHYFNYLIGMKIITQNPVSGIRIKGVLKNKVMNCLTEDELELVFLQFCNHVSYASKESKERDTVLLGLIIFQALTPQELTALLVTDVSLEEGMITIPETNRSNVRQLALHAKQMLHMMHYVHSKKGDRLFDVGVPNSMHRVLRQINKLDYKGLNHQQLRASRIVIWLKQYNVRQVQYYTGMRYISSLKIYQQQLTDELKHELMKFHPLG